VVFKRQAIDEAIHTLNNNYSLKGEPVLKA
jgi:hypothetical protein